MSMQRIFFTLLLTVSYCVVSLPTSNTSTIDVNQKINFKYRENCEGISQCLMLQEGVNGTEVIGFICIVQGKHFAKFASPKFDAIDFATIDIANSDPNIVSSLALTRAIKSKHDLHEAVVLGGLYIPAEHRGKGFAQQLINKVCQDAFQEGTKIIVINPDPFEYENGKIVSLHDSPDYVDKQQRLITLFQKCGFTTDNNDPISFMYRNA